ncbi:MAG: aminoacyl-tRNA hydrolase [Planctomycetota bacterium]
MRIVVGLGNPGAQYERTLHNLGFQVLDRVAQRLHLPWRAGDGPYLEARGSERGEAFALVKPTTYMNLSGAAVQAFAQRGELDPRALARRAGRPGPAHGAAADPQAGLGRRTSRLELADRRGWQQRLRAAAARHRLGPAAGDAAEYVLGDPLSPVERTALNASIDSASMPLYYGSMPAFY